MPDHQHLADDEKKLAVPPAAGWRHPAVRRWGPMLVLALLAFVFLMPALRGMYIWDDAQWLTMNPVIPDPHGLSKIWTDTTATVTYYPLVFTSYWLEYRAFGLGTVGADGVLRGVGYHVDNLLLHIGSALLIFAILRRLKLPGEELGAWLAATLFAIHPVSVESVAWVAERKNCLCGIFFFAAMLGGVHFFAVAKDEADAKARGEFKNSWGWYVATVLFFVGSMLAKTVACVLPPALLVLIWWRRGKVTAREFLLTLPLFAIALGMGAMTAHLEQASAGATGAAFQFTWLQRILIAGNALVFYAEKLVWPTPVMQIYPRFPIVAGQPIDHSWLYLPPLFAVATMVILFRLRRQITRGPIAAALLFAGMLFPALGFLNFYTMVYTFVADHYQYLACVPFLVLLVEILMWAIRRLSVSINTDDPARFRRMAYGLVTVGIVLALGMQTYAVSSLYDNTVALWKFNVDNNPQASFVWLNLGDSLTSQVPPDRQGAAQAYTQAIRLDPTDWQGYRKMGVLLLPDAPEAGQKYLSKADELMPDFVRNNRSTYLSQETQNTDIDPGLEPQGPDYSAALILEQHENWDAAIAGFARELKANPHSAPACFEMGNCYMGKNDFTKAVDCYQQAIAIKHRYAQAFFNLGMALAQLHRNRDAIAALETARQIDPTVLRHVAGLNTTAPAPPSAFPPPTGR